MLNTAEITQEEDRMNMMHLMPSEKNQRLLDIAARADAKEGIRQGLEDAENGRLRPAREFFAEFETRHGIHKKENTMSIRPAQNLRGKRASKIRTSPSR